MKRLCTLLFYLTPCLAQAESQRYPEPGTVITYDAALSAAGQAPNLSKVTTEFLSADDDVVVVNTCDMSGCSVRAYRDFLQTLVHVPVETPLPVGTTLDDLIDRFGVEPIVVTDTGGQGLSSWEEGSQTWEEDWSPLGFNISYVIASERACCQTPDQGIAAGQSLWAVKYEFSPPEGAGGASGAGVYGFSPDLGWYLTYDLDITSKNFLTGEESVSNYQLIAVSVELPDGD